MDPLALANHAPVFAKSSRVTPVAEDFRDTPLSHGRLNLELEDMEMGYTDEKVKIPDFFIQSKDSQEMPLERYGFWMQALTKGNMAEIDSILKNADTFEQQKMICGKFVFPNEEVVYATFGPLIAKEMLHSYVDSKNSTGQSLVSTNALITLLSYGHMNVVFKLIKMGADVHSAVMFNWNFIHVLSVMSVQSPTSQEAVQIFRQMREFIVDHPDLGMPALHKLLMAEDDVGFRPVELASRIGALDMVNEIFNTEGVYRFTKTLTGYHNVAYYDITDYSLHGKRNQFNPLALLLLISYERVAQLTNSSLFLMTPLMIWAQKYIKSYLWFMRFWMMYRLAYVICFMVFFQDLLVVTFFGLKRDAMHAKARNLNTVANVSSEGFDFGCDMKSFTSFSPTTLFLILSPLLGFRLMTTIIGHTFDMRMFLGKLRKAMTKILADEKNLRTIGNCGFYLKCDFLHVICAGLVAISVRAMDLTEPGQRTFAFICIAVTSICNVWSCLYFLRLHSIVGYFVVTFQEMIGNMFNFLIVQFLIILSFSVTFFAIIGSQCLHTGFDSFGQSFYTTFITMLNMVAFTNEVDILTPEGIVVVILHVIYVLVVAILLLNFLIALMSDTVNQVSKYKTIINRLHRLFVCLTIANRLGFFVSKYNLFQSEYILKNNKVYFASTYKDAKLSVTA